jgi:hypothetical protein
MVAPAGQTPIIRRFLTNDHLPAISGISLDSRVCMQVQEDAYKREHVVRFLKHLLRQIPGKRRQDVGQGLLVGGVLAFFTASGSSAKE